MDEEILLKRRLIDTANKAYRQNIYTYTNFLSMSELDTYYRTLPELSFIHSEAFGGKRSRNTLQPVKPHHLQRT